MDEEYVLNAEKLAKVVLPNRNGFYPDIDGMNGTDPIENIRAFYADRAKNIGSGTRCSRGRPARGADVETASCTGALSNSQPAPSWGTCGAWVSADSAPGNGTRAPRNSRS